MGDAQRTTTCILSISLSTMIRFKIKHTHTLTDCNVGGRGERDQICMRPVVEIVYGRRFIASWARNAGFALALACIVII